MQIHRAPGMTGLQASALGVLPALTVGLAVMRLCEAPVSFLSLQMVGASAGFLLVGMFARQLAGLVRERPVRVCVGSLAAIAATLAMPGLDGVHRWLTIGGLRLHAGALTEPLLLAAVVSLWLHRRAVAALAAFGAALTLHLVQPDAGQATALAAGGIALAALPAASVRARAVLGTAAVLGLVATWARPDALLPTDLVENIVPMAFDLSAVLGVVAVATLVAMPLVAVHFSTAPRPIDPLQRGYGVALAAYLTGSLAAVVLGDFPTPVLGYGASPLLGTVLGLGVLGELADGRGVD